MRILIDTCTLVWFMRADSQLSARAAEIIEAPDSIVFISVVSIWELTIKAQLGKIQAPAGIEGPLKSQLEQAGFTFLSVTYEHAAGINLLPDVHRDPFDRLLISQCRCEALTAVTPDEHWHDPRYGIPVLW